MNLRSYIVVFLFVCGASISLAQKPHFKEKRMAKRIERHINYLASDELEGRLSASENDRKSAEYIAEEFESLGLQPAGEQGDFYQYIPTSDLRLAQSATSLTLGVKSQKLFRDFYPLSATSNNGIYSGEAVNVGYGVEDDGLKHHDYEGKNVEGKVVLINMDIPGGVHPHNRYISWSGVEFRVDYAKTRGAKGVIYYASDESVFPSGELAMTLENSGVPVLFVKQDLMDTSSIEVQLKVDILQVIKNAHNVLAFIDNQASRTVVIGAHHDHLGRGQKGGSLAEIPGQIHNGADDNASGVAGLFELARAIAKRPKKFANNNYLFIAFSGEEQGLVGSKFFVNSELMPQQKVNFMINMDMIGHLDSTKKTLIINGVGSSPSWKEAIQMTKYSTKKIAKVKTTESGIGASDHTSFYLANIPSVHFFTGQHHDYHKPTDDPSIINYGGEAFILSYMTKMLKVLNTQGELMYEETAEEEPTRMDFKVTLGIMPDYIFEGEGMRVDGVKPERVGDQAGMKKGDVIIGMGDYNISNIQDYMKVLSTYNKNDKTTVTIRRDSAVKILNVTF